jgi:hypothetical protein
LAGAKIDEMSKLLNNEKLVKKIAELAELVDALDSGSSVCKDFRVQVPGSASRKIRNPQLGWGILFFSDVLANVDDQ